MAKPLGPKSSLIRDALKAHPGVGNKELADMINSSPARREDRIVVRPADVAQQKQAMKKSARGAGRAAAKNGRRKSTGRKGGRPRASTASTPQARPAAAPAGGSLVDLLEKVFDLAKACGGFGALKRLVDRCADLEHR
jgi:hypothetical protein